MRLNFFLPLLIFATFSGCASERFVYKLYAGPIRAEENLAVLTLRAGTAVSIDGINISSDEYHQVNVMPGSHLVTYGHFYAITSWTDSGPVVGTVAKDTGSDCQPSPSKLGLLAGREYEVRATEDSNGLGMQIFDLEIEEIVWQCLSN